MFVSYHGFQNIFRNVSAWYIFLRDPISRIITIFKPVILQFIPLNSLKLLQMMTNGKVKDIAIQWSYISKTNYLKYLQFFFKYQDLFLYNKNVFF